MIELGFYLLFPPHAALGTGIQIKLLEALAHGVPAVVMELVAGPLELRNQTDGVLIVKSAAEMAWAVQGLLEDDSMWERLHLDARRFAIAGYSSEALQQAIQLSLEGIQRTACLIHSVQRERLRSKD